MLDGSLAAAADASALAGMAAATGAAMLWAASTLLYSHAGLRVSAAVLNFVKGTLAVGMFVATMLVLGRPIVAPVHEAPAAGVLLLAISGIVGIGVGDTAYFACIRNLGPRQATLLSLLAVPLAAIGGLLILGERLGALGWLGIGVTLCGIAWVVSERAPAAVEVRRRHVMAGVALGALAGLCQASGALMNRHVLRQGTEVFDPLWTATWRLAIGTAVLMLWIPLAPKLPFDSQRRSRPFWRYLVPATLMGTYGGIWLQQVAFARADAGYVQTLLSTTPLWVIPLVMLAGERVSPRALMGSVVALGGVVLLIVSTRAQAP